MHKRRKVLPMLIVLLLVLATGWEIASPWLTLMAMRDAARARDGEKLAAYIDFAKLRASVRDELDEAIAARTPVPGLAAWVGKLGGAVVSPVVDVIVSPAALRVALLSTPASQGGASPRKCGVKRDGLRHFRLRCAKMPNGEGDLVFQQRGLGWVLVGADLPADYGAAVR